MLLNVFEAYRELYTAENVVSLAKANPQILEIVSWVRQLEQEEMAREAKELARAAVPAPARVLTQAGRQEAGGRGE